MNFNLHKFSCKKNSHCQKTKHENLQLITIISFRGIKKLHFKVRIKAFQSKGSLYSVGGLKKKERGTARTQSEIEKIS